jgi:uncharacterized repeat protein (TIGR01451 family)
MRTLKPTTFMRNRIFKIGIGLAAGAMMFSSAAVAVPTMKTLSGHVPSVVSRLQAKGSLPTTNSLHLAIGLPLRNGAALSNLIQQIYDPASPNYHHYLTPEEFTAQFGPTEEDYQKVIAFAQANGLTVVGTHPNRMLLDVSGNAGNVGSAFHVAFRVYHHPTENRDFYAPDVEPSVPSTLPVQDISGLNNYGRSHPKYRLKPANVSSVVAPEDVSKATIGKAANGSGPAGNYIGNDFRNAYVPGTSLNGSGQVVGLYEEDGYLSSDISAYENLAGLSSVPLQNVLIDGVTGVPSGNGGEIEVSLDIEMAVSMAPGLSKVIVYEGPYGFQNDILNRIASDNAAKQIGCSWGWLGGPSATTDQIFQQMAVQGQTFFNASGDGDAFTAGAGSVNGVDNPDTFNAPSDSPYITQVGGTTLRMNGAGASYVSETVWNWDVRYGSGADGIGSSGGISSYYSIPSWQTNVNMTVPQGSTTFRNTPDVALTADDVLVIADGGVEYLGEGGTSCAAPLWAGFTALVNQFAANNAHAPVGFINPALYAIAAGANYTNCFHDITTGNDEWSGSPNLFSATTGYDLCTGLGTPNGTNLIFALAASANTITRVSTPPPPYGSTLTTLTGANPNGSWYLYELDDGVFDHGVITNGWILNLTTANPVGASADNALSMTASAGNISIGGTGVYILTVTNYGPSSATNILVSDTLPSGVTLISSNNTLGSVSRTVDGLSWSIGALNTNAGAQLTLTVQLNSNGSFTSTAFVTAGTPDPNPDDASASATLNAIIVTPPQLSGAATGSGGKFLFSVTSGSGQTNVVQSSTNLINWVPVFTNIGPFTFTNTILPGYPVQFYRDLILGP